MATVAAETEIAAPVAGVWDLYFEPASWPAWVDQFADVVASEGYPEEGGTLRWRSGRAGRGEVSERVLEHVPRSRHRIAFSDPETEGELVTTFEPTPAGTRCRLEMSYRLADAGAFGLIADGLFGRSQMRASLARSLVGLRAELEGL
jgi:uncharacterized protein YndB with AHSA1/START domain